MANSNIPTDFFLFPYTQLMPLVPQTVLVPQPMNPFWPGAAATSSVPSRAINYPTQPLPPVQQQQQHASLQPRELPRNTTNVFYCDPQQPPPLQNADIQSRERTIQNTSDEAHRSDVVGQDKILEMTRLALKGCDLGEKIALNHQKRPCFKKIDSLCARMKQDLVRADGVLANINSQGIAWAAKDFIFVFTRIVNAWVIIKGYANNKSEGLTKVRSGLSPTFAENFLKWQESSMIFIDDLMKSFSNLDQMVQTQRSNANRMESGGSRFTGFEQFMPDESFEDSYSSNSSAECSDPSAKFNKEFFSTVIANSEEAQVKHMENGTYFKTGVYNPIKKSMAMMNENQVPVTSYFTTSTPTKILKSPFSRKIESLEQNCNEKAIALASGEGDRRQFCPECCGNSDNGSEGKNYKRKSVTAEMVDNVIIRKTYDVDMAQKIQYLLERILSFNEAEYFFIGFFTENYFPGFHTINPNYIDIRSIFLKGQAGGYENIYEIVHDLRQVVYSGRKYLQEKFNELLLKSLHAFEMELEEMFVDEAFYPLNFDGITGEPRYKN